MESASGFSLKSNDGTFVFEGSKAILTTKDFFLVTGRYNCFEFGFLCIRWAFFMEKPVNFSLVR